LNKEKEREVAERNEGAVWDEQLLGTTQLRKRVRTTTATENVGNSLTERQRARGVPRSRWVATSIYISTRETDAKGA